MVNLAHLRFQPCGLVIARVALALLQRALGRGKDAVSPFRQPMRRHVRSRGSPSRLSPRISCCTATSFCLAEKRSPGPASAPPPPACGAHADRPEPSVAPGFNSFLWFHVLLPFLRRIAQCCVSRNRAPAQSWLRVCLASSTLPAGCRSCWR